MKVNSAYRKLYTSNNRYNIVYGGAGSAKSYELAQYLLVDCLRKKVNILVIRKVGSTLKDSVLKLFQDVIRTEGLEKFFKLNKTDKEYTTATGNFIIMKGLDDPEKIKSIYGVDVVWIEEASELLEDDWNQLLLRLRGGNNKKRFYFSFNPININHWLKKRFFDVPPDDTLVLHTTYKDNAFLDDEYKVEIERLKEIDSYWYSVYALGEWGSLDDALIFHNYGIHDFEVDNSAQVYSGQDWGFNDPSAFEQCYMKDQELYIFNENYVTGKTNTELMEMQNEYKSFSVIADSSEPARIKEFVRNGFKYRSAQKGKDSIKMGLDYLKRFNKIHIHKTNCPEIAKEFQLYKYKQVKRDGEMIIEDEPLDKNNHGIDAIRYALEPFWNIRKPQVKLNRRVF